MKKEQILQILKDNCTSEDGLYGGQMHQFNDSNLDTVAEEIEHKSKQLENIFNPVLFNTNAGEKLSICMRDSGFEFTYEGVKYYAKEGVLDVVSSERIVLNENEIPVTNKIPQLN